VAFVVVAQKQPLSPGRTLVQVFPHLGPVALVPHLASHDLRPVAPGRLPGLTLEHRTSLAGRRLAPSVPAVPECAGVISENSGCEE
jgi:hypothetical protein